MDAGNLVGLADCPGLPAASLHWFHPLHPRNCSGAHLVWHGQDPAIFLSPALWCTLRFVLQAILELWQVLVHLWELALNYWTAATVCHTTQVLFRKLATKENIKEVLKSVYRCVCRHACKMSQSIMPLSLTSAIYCRIHRRLFEVRWVCMLQST